MKMLPVAPFVCCFLVFLSSGNQFNVVAVRFGAFPLGSGKLFRHTFNKTSAYPTDFSDKVPDLHLSAKNNRAQSWFSAALLHVDLITNPSSPNNHSTGGGSRIDDGRTIRHSKHLKKIVLVTIIVVATCLGFIVLCSLVLCLCRNKFTKEACGSKRNGEADTTEAGIWSLGPWITRLNSIRIASKKGPACALDYALLQVATRNFSTDNLLGRGSSGCVYKARLEDDFFAAVKLLDGKQKHTERNFQAEVELMNRIRHPNLVSLLGYSIHERQHLLVYELMQNGSVEDQLHGPSRGSALTWNLRIKIALDAARGLEHLHERCNPPVIHRDFKSSNILLDSSFNAKVSDFGLAIVNYSDERSIELQGTLGYIAPEYLLDGNLSEKSDVYAFGVVLLELITGRKPVDTAMQPQSLVTWATPQLTDRSKVADMLDVTLQNDSMNLKHLYQVAAIAALCIQPEPSYRPLIADVVNSLIPLVPMELGGAMRSSELPRNMGMEMETFSFTQDEMKSLSFSDYSSKLSDYHDHIKHSMSAGMADEFCFSQNVEWNGK